MIHDSPPWREKLTIFRKVVLVNTGMSGRCPNTINISSMKLSRIYSCGKRYAQNAPEPC